MPKYNIQAVDGSRQEIDVEVEDYRAAGEAGLTLSQYLGKKFPADPSRGTTFEQCMQAAGLFIRPDRDSGIRPPTMQAVLNGSVQFNSGPITRNDGSQNNTVTGRLLFPEVILQMIESELTTNYGDYLNGYDNMVAVTESVSSPKVDQPIINVTAPQADEVRSQPIAQLAEPAALITITLAEKSFRIPTKAIGLTIADQALEATSLDLVGMAFTQQARMERVRVVNEALSAMISGDVDFNEVAIADTNAVTDFDSGAAAGTVTQVSWVKWLRKQYQKMTVTNIICDIDTAIAIENRSGRPTMYGVDGSAIASTSLADNPSSERIDALMSIENLGLPAPRALLVETAISGANTIIGLDNRYAIRRVVNVNAAYSAIEQYVMRRATSFRVDYGEMSQKLMPDAWTLMTIPQA